MDIVTDKIGAAELRLVSVDAETLEGFVGLFAPIV